MAQRTLAELVADNMAVVAVVVVASIVVEEVDSMALVVEVVVRIVVVEVVGSRFAVVVVA